MSYDIRVWSINKLNLPDSLPMNDQWEMKNENAHYFKQRWQIVVNNPIEVDKEDINKEIFSLLPGIAYLTELNLEPMHSPESAKSILLKFSKEIAKDTMGIIEDPQMNTVMAPSGVIRFIQPKTEKGDRFSILEMTWKFGNNPLSKKEIMFKLIDYFESTLPEALPKRYGEYEPPKHKYAEEGKENLKIYLSEHIYQNIVW